jgi:hypothetical protein
MTTTETTQAEQVARNYAATIRAIEDLAEAHDDYPSAERLSEMADELADELAEHPEQFTLTERAAQQMDIDQIRSDAAWITENLPDHYKGDPYAASYVEGVLEVVYRGYFDMYHAHRWQCDEVQLLVAYGGPTVRVIAQDNTNHITIKASWGSDTAEVTTYAPHLAGYLQEMTETL